MHAQLADQATPPVRGWLRDVEVESTPLDTTGGHTWRAAYRLADFLEAMAAQLCLSQPGGVTLLELGSGCGWLGCTLARNLPPSSLVVLTEQAGGLEWLAHNLHRNAGRRLPGLGSVRVQACDWLQFAPPGFELPASGGDSCSDSGTAVGEQREQQQRGCHSLEEAGGQASPASASASAVEGAAAARPGSGEAEAPALDLHSVEWDFIVGSDLIYNQVGSRCLPHVLAALAGPATQVFYAHTKHRYDLLDLEFFEELGQCGLHCEEVWEPGMPPPPQSPPLQFPPVELFPKQRIAVYRITHAAAVPAAAEPASGQEHR